MRKTPPYRLQTPGLVLRCYSPADAPLLAEAVRESVAHLLPFMEWAAAEPEPLEVKVERLRRFRRQFDADQEYVYGIFDLSESRLLGGTGLHTRPAGNALEIGYWVRVSALRQGVAAGAAAALTRVGFDFCGVERMEIHCSAQFGAQSALGGGSV